MEVGGEAPRRSGDSSSPEFEFWMMGNQSFPQPHLLTADELFVDGVLLPLQLLSLTHYESKPEHLKPEQVHEKPKPEQVHEKPKPVPELPPPSQPESPSIASISSCLAPSSVSKRWKEIFKVREKKTGEREKKRERKNNAGGAAELNISIWPFSRSRSAGTGGQPKASVATRKASSAPCSRSNSRGESTKPSAAAAPRRWTASPGRSGLSGGVYVGRASPVWQLRRTNKEKSSNSTGGGKKANGGTRGLNLNVNTCMGYRNQVSCRNVDKDGLAGGGQDGGDGGTGNGSLFNLRTLFSKVC